ncbi:MAG: HDOD domain-containing protein [Desulfovibrio sp.]|nr:MAG: HDOD domain-containing protein [Desulfovibrio sp.]
MSTVNEILEKARLVPMLSQSALALMKLVESGDHSIQDIVRIVEHDPALTANVLKVVNAPAFGLGQSVTSLARAVSFIGDKLVVGIAIGSCSPTVFHSDLEGYESLAGELWLHSLRTAIASRELTKYARTEISPELAFTAGILHDIGKSLISDYLKDKTPELLDALTNNTAEDFLGAERDAVGVDHCQVGTALAEHWNLPDELTAPIHFHHDPAQADISLRAITYAVHLGDILAMMGGSSTGADGLAYTLDSGFEEYFTLEPQDIYQLLLTVSLEFERTKTLFFQ